MNPRRIFGAALLAIGIILLVIGMNSSHSFADQISNTFTGHFTDSTTWYIIGGVFLGITGLSLTLFSSGGKSA